MSGLPAATQYQDWLDHRETDAVKFTSTTTQAAAVRQHCDTCQHSIGIGIRYRRTVAMYRGDRAPHVTREHIDCSDEQED